MTTFLVSGTLSSGGAGVSAAACPGVTQPSAVGSGSTATPTIWSRSPPSDIASPGSRPMPSASRRLSASSPGPRGSRPAITSGRSIVAPSGSAERMSRSPPPAAATRTSRRGAPASATSGSAAASATAAGGPITSTCAPFVARMRSSNGSSITARRCSVTSSAQAAIAITRPVSAAWNGRWRRSARIRRPAARSISPPAAARGRSRPRRRPRPRGRTPPPPLRRASAARARRCSPRAGRGSRARSPGPRRSARAAR